MKTFKLTPTDNRKTLSNQHVNEYKNNNNEVVSDLISYTTKVASYNHIKNEMDVFGYYSKTTARQINHFLEFYGFDKCNKQQLENY